MPTDLITISSSTLSEKSISLRYQAGQLSKGITPEPSKAAFLVATNHIQLLDNTQAMDINFQSCFPKYVHLTGVPVHQTDPHKIEKHENFYESVLVLYQRDELGFLESQILSQRTVTARRAI